jgi:hypothetical protein
VTQDRASGCVCASLPRDRRASQHPASDYTLNCEEPVISKDGFSSGADFLATCDNRSHTVDLFNPGPYTPGIAPVVAHVQSFSGISRADTNVQVTIK